jgi:hypothetical protein
MRSPAISPSPVGAAGQREEHQDERQRQSVIEPGFEVPDRHLAAAHDGRGEGPGRRARGSPRPAGGGPVQAHEVVGGHRDQDQRQRQAQPERPAGQPPARPQLAQRQPPPSTINTVNNARSASRLTSGPCEDTSIHPSPPGPTSAPATRKISAVTAPFAPPARTAPPSPAAPHRTSPPAPRRCPLLPGRDLLGHVAARAGRGPARYIHRRRRLAVRSVSRSSRPAGTRPGRRRRRCRVPRRSAAGGSGGCGSGAPPWPAAPTAATQPARRS